MLQTGQTINGSYEVLEPVGEGGAGQVFLAWHKNLQKKVVIKRIKDDYVGRINERGEADILKNLRHSNLPQVYDFIQMDREVYTVIDYIDGNSLAEYISAGVRFDEFQLIKWLRELCDALDYLHTQNPPIIHSDIKPSNIMVDSNGKICLIDFNISTGEDDENRITGYSEAYASPEQVRRVQTYKSGGDYKKIRLDARSDIFSLGATFYHLMTLKNPMKVMNDYILPWDDNLPYSDLFTSIIKKALEASPKKRFQSAAEMLNSINTMKLRDSRYRRLKRSQFIYTLVFACMLAGGGLMISRGAVIRNEENFDRSYSAIVAGAADDDQDNTINSSLSLLNDRKYTDLLKVRTKEKADLLFLTANAYFEKDDYNNAVKFYAMAIEADGSSPEYFRDYAIALARSGDTAKAEAVLKKGIDKGMKDPDLYLAMAELAADSKNWKEAIKDYEKVISSTDNEDTLGRAYTLCARAYAEDRDFEKADKLLEKAGNEVDETWKMRIIRERGSVCIRYLEENGEAADKEWIKTAEECFTVLTGSDSATENDWLNLATIKEMSGDINSAEKVLQSIEGKYPDDYKIPMKMAQYELIIQADRNEALRDYSDAEKYYEQAEQLYEKVKNSGAGDDEMQKLEKLMQEVHDKGWL